jgi:DNA-binding NarL/FixJ family response regulator
VYLSPTVAHAVLAEYVAPAGSSRSARGTASGSNAHPCPLSPREREILRRVADGESSKQIAAALAIGLKTVDTHRRRLMEKLNRHSVAELTKYAVQQGLTSLETTV